MVWLFTPTLGARGTLKIHSNWSGPWKVIRRIKDLIFEILATEETGYRGKLVVSIDRLRLYLKDQDTPNPLSKFTASLAQEGNEFLKIRKTIVQPRPTRECYSSMPCTLKDADRNRYLNNTGTVSYTHLTLPTIYSV